MRRWPVILAAVVIFAAGAATGAIAIRAYAPKTANRTQVSPPLPVGPEKREDYLSRLDRELQLSPEQREKISGILAASQERMKGLWKSIEPQTKEEYQQTRKQIWEILTPEQREKKKQMRHGRERDDKKQFDKPADSRPDPKAASEIRSLPSPEVQGVLTVCFSETAPRFCRHARGFQSSKRRLIDTTKTAG